MYCRVNVICGVGVEDEEVYSSPTQQICRKGPLYSALGEGARGHGNRLSVSGPRCRETV